MLLGLCVYFKDIKILKIIFKAIGFKVRTILVSCIQTVPAGENIKF
jgi:hypothetical protein